MKSQEVAPLLARVSRFRELEKQLAEIQANLDTMNLPSDDDPDNPFTESPTKAREIYCLHVNLGPNSLRQGALNVRFGDLRIPAAVFASWLRGHLNQSAAVIRAEMEAL